MVCDMEHCMAFLLRENSGIDFLDSTSLGGI